MAPSNIASNIDIIRFEMDDAGNHRLRLGNHKGDWMSYSGVSTLVLPNGDWYIAVTQYYDGYLPTEKALKIDQGIASMSVLVDGIRPQ